ACVSELVVSLAFGFIAEDTVGFCGFFKAIFGLGISGVLVGVILNGELSVRSFNFGARRRAFYTEDFVIIALFGHDERVRMEGALANGTDAVCDKGAGDGPMGARENKKENNVRADRYPPAIFCQGRAKKYHAGVRGVSQRTRRLATTARHV